MLYIVTYFYFTQLSNPTTDYVLLFLLFRKNNEVNNTLVFFLKDVGYYFWAEATHNKNNLIKVGNIFGVKNTICPF
jgi:nicotinamide riboside transporter PnuC